MISDSCEPIVTLDQLLNYRSDSIKWCEMVAPLVERSKPRLLLNNYYSLDTGNLEPIKTDEFTRPEVLVCHDYKGNYLDDKFINGTQKYEEYRFYNWSAVDIFCYFSHNLVTIPTLQFLNAAHKNGVKVMGTFIVEDTSGASILNDQILTTKEKVRQVAESLFDISRRLRFEGWLLNIETSVRPEKVELLQYFVEYLTKKMHEIKNGKVIWYDSVTKDGKLMWQNEMNQFNEVFFDLCDGIFLNYTWTQAHLERTAELVERKYKNRRHHVYFGIDVFGRGQVAEFNTYKTLKQVFQFKFSTAIFAPGWTFETMILPEHLHKLSTIERSDEINAMFLKRNDAFWSLLWDYFYTFGPTSLPFSTNFCIGSGKNKYRLGRIVDGNWFNLKRQGFQSSTPTQKLHLSHYYADAFDGGSSISLDTRKLIRMFICEFHCDNDIIFSYSFKREDLHNDLDFHLRVSNRNSKTEKMLICGENSNDIDPAFFTNLEFEDMKAITISLARSKQIFVPGNRISGWETRYYLLKFNKRANYLITDIGVMKRTDGLLLIGNLAIYSGDCLDMNKFNHLPIVQF
ncbi:unnamed protein product [Diamesa hyperborea]